MRARAAAPSKAGEGHSWNLNPDNLITEPTHLATTPSPWKTSRPVPGVRGCPRGSGGRNEGSLQRGTALLLESDTGELTLLDHEDTE